MAASLPPTDATTEPIAVKMQNTKYRQLTLGAPAKQKKQILKETKGNFCILEVNCVDAVVTVTGINDKTLIPSRGQ